MRLARASFTLALVASIAAATSVFAQGQGPSSSATAYAVPSASGWGTVSLISVQDFAENGYSMVGIPDGLGALAGRFRNGRYVDTRSYMTVFMNHEIGAGIGVPRAHGQNGAFVSQWTINLNTLKVEAGQDLIESVYKWDTLTSQYLLDPTAQFGRLCSADLPALKAFFNPKTGRGFRGRLFMDGEEIGNEGRGFAHVLSGDAKGVSYQLPYLGRFSWENSVAHPDAGDKTVVVGLDDSTPGEVYVYMGQKRNSGNPVERAGLVGGSLFGIKVTNGGANYGGSAVTRESNGAINGFFVLQGVPAADVLGTGANLQTKSVELGISEFARPEDGAWDTRNPRVFYFVTTGANLGTTAAPNNQTARLYKLTFDSLSNPTGGTIELVVDRGVGMGPLATPIPPSTSIVAMFDNITVDGDGAVLIEEDPGNNDYIAKIWRVNPATKTAVEVVHSDPARFGPPTPQPFNVDEESSGIIEVTGIVESAWWFQHGRRYFLADMQAHYGIQGEAVEGGQLYLIASPKRPSHGDHDGDEHD